MIVRTEKPLGPGTGGFFARTYPAAAREIPIATIKHSTVEVTHRTVEIEFPPFG